MSRRYSVNKPNLASNMLLWRAQLAPDGATWLIGTPSEISEMRWGQQYDEAQRARQVEASRWQRESQVDDEIYSQDKETVISLLESRAREYVEDEAWVRERIKFWTTNR
jgi:hypothetical protein